MTVSAGAHFFARIVVYANLGVAPKGTSGLVEGNSTMQPSITVGALANESASAQPAQQKAGSPG